VEVLFMKIARKATAWVEERKDVGSYRRLLRKTHHAVIISICRCQAGIWAALTSVLYDLSSVNEADGNFETDLKELSDSGWNRIIILKLWVV
jgi:hypothetical protein